MFDTYIPHYTKLTERKPHIEMELNKLGINDAKFITDFDGDSLTSEDTTNYITEFDYFHVAVEPSVRKLGIDRIEQTTLKNSEISLILKVGALSSSVIVRIPVASLILAFVALDKVRVTVSLFSSVLSPKTGTVKVLVVSPASKVSVPLEEV